MQLDAVRCKFVVRTHCQVHGAEFQIKRGERVLQLMAPHLFGCVATECEESGGFVSAERASDRSMTLPNPQVSRV